VTAEVSKAEALLKEGAEVHKVFEGIAKKAIEGKHVQDEFQEATTRLEKLQHEMRTSMMRDKERGALITITTCTMWISDFVRAKLNE
jgi:hypothetical protein